MRERDVNRSTTSIAIVRVDEIRLVVQGDDFGMCHAVNEGVSRAFRDGIVTQASLMTACPWFHEAADLARTFAIPVGLHQTLTCEWDFLRWGPLTAAPSLRSPDGTFYRTIADVQAKHTNGDAVAELVAQAARARDAGLQLRYADVHMGSVAPAAYQRVATDLAIPFLYPGLDASMEFTSIAMLSARRAVDKKGWFLHHLGRLTPGLHLVVTHPGVGGSELAALTSPTSGPAPWAEAYRVSDLAVLLDPEVRAAIEKRGIVLTSV
jgi:hypothetical protein